MPRGYFFVFEGTEGSGKSTQVRLLADRLTAVGQHVLTTREPGGTEAGEAIRALILADHPEPIDPRTEALLHTAARAEHVSRVIRPALGRGEIVISDRFLDSTLAYQGGGSGLPLDELAALQRFATGDTIPDLRILLVVPVKDGLARRFAEQGQLNRIDREHLAFHQRVAATFLDLARCEPDRWIVISGEGNPAEVGERVATELGARYSDLELT